LPGVNELLEALAKTDKIIALYTGDSPGIVKHVMSSTDLGKYFRFCVYGTEAGTRVELVKLAIKKAGEITGSTFDGNNVVIIGDSTRDIDCGKEVGAVTIAVTTGPHPPEELAAHHPDYLFQSMKDFDRVLVAIG
jgi:phosphoglycolate phosphatase-like HAD superfamily hydrolase